MRIVEINYSKKSISDQESIWVYTFNSWSKVQADKYLRELTRSINHLKSFPFSNPIIKSLPGSIRVYKVRNHLICYSVTASHSILVVRVLHTNMKIRSIL